jgi:hypothetical protein
MEELKVSFLKDVLFADMPIGVLKHVIMPIKARFAY